MDYPFSFIALDDIEKPRSIGLTSLIDKGLDLSATQDLLDHYANYIDIVKLGFGTARLVPYQKLKAKIKLLTDAGMVVCPGGTFFEIAFNKNLLQEFLSECKNLGFNAIEISDGVKPIPLAKRAELVKQIQDTGFKAFVEIGRKDSQDDRKFLIEERIIEANTFIKLGVEKIIIEAREAGNVGIFDDDLNINQLIFENLVNVIDPEYLIFEAPHKHQQAWLINKVGRHVNLGNISPQEILPVTCLRFALRADTIKL